MVPKILGMRKMRGSWLNVGITTLLAVTVLVVDMFAGAVVAQPSGKMYK